MNFAKKQLEKYGWSEGKGLGKNEDGIAIAIKPKLKFDTTGVGHDAGEEFTNNWWNNIYNKALNNIEVETDNGNVKVNLKSKDSFEISTSSYSIEKNNKNQSSYGNFLKTEKLTTEGVVNINKDVNDNSNISSTSKLPTISDDELFAACGGRTAHKGARHGLRLSGKLSRIEKQEKLLLKKLQKVTLEEDKNVIKKKIKKISSNKKHNLIQMDDMLIDDYDSRSSTGSITPKKKSKKKKKSVSFKYVVKEYTTHEPLNTDDDTHAVVTTVEEVRINDDATCVDVCRKSFKEAETKKEVYVKKKKKKDKKHKANLYLDGMDLDNVKAGNCKCRKRKLHESDKDTCNIKEIKQKKKKSKKEDRIDYISKSLDQICNISDIKN